MQVRRHWPVAVAGVAASATFVLSGIIRGTYPFGDRTRSTNDLTFNDPMLTGGQGSQYYSSTIPDTTSKALIALGFGYTSRGRQGHQTHHSSRPPHHRRRPHRHPPNVRRTRLRGRRVFGRRTALAPVRPNPLP
ncbi:hypothetical protein ACIA49_23190 [Kribbella sp. NPDC051587]|uniref:hypothetical protein n=1 Tax=Kribbella sp. NPDC051587 TaxID=3364119 RepID=UPI003792AA47